MLLQTHESEHQVGLKLISPIQNCSDQYSFLQETGRFLLHLPAGGVWRFPLQGSLPSKISPTQWPLTPPGGKNQVKFQPGFHENHFSPYSICNRLEILPGVRPYVGLVVLHQSIPTSTSYTLIRCWIWVSNIKNMFCRKLPEIINMQWCFLCILDLIESNK